MTLRDATPSNMADKENRSMDVDKRKNKPYGSLVKPLADEVTQRKDNRGSTEGEKDAEESRATTQYCEKLQAWMWQYYSGYVNWQSWLAASAMSYPYCLQPPNGTSTVLDINSQHWHNNPFGLPLSPYPPAAGSSSGRAGEAIVGAAVPAQPQQQARENGNAPRPGKSCYRLYNHIRFFQTPRVTTFEGYDDPLALSAFKKIGRQSGVP